MPLCTMATFIINIALICLSATLVAAHNLTEAEVLAFAVPTEVREKFPYYLSGHDEDGAPIWIFELGKWDLRKYVERGEEMFETLDLSSHHMFLHFRESGLNSSAKQFVLIVDLDEFNIRQAGHPKTVQLMIQQFVRLETILRDGAIKQGFIVNSNLLFESIWRVGGPLLGSLTNFVELYGTNKDVWIPKLLKSLPKDQLPERYGGFPGYKPLRTFG